MEVIGLQEDQFAGSFGVLNEDFGTVFFQGQRKS
jgi:hypothetical protein